jgi:hypothetical protein
MIIKDTPRARLCLLIALTIVVQLEILAFGVAIYKAATRPVIIVVQQEIPIGRKSL